MALTYIVGEDILSSDATVIVNTVNCHATMGAGLAKQVRVAYPACYRPYAEACNNHTLRPGMILSWKRPDGGYVWHAATKDDWHDPSRIEWVEDILQRIVSQWTFLRGKSIALTPLGCGLGKLEWSAVGPLMFAYLSDLDGVDVRIYLPQGWDRYERSPIDGEITALHRFELR